MSDPEGSGTKAASAPSFLDPREPLSARAFDRACSALSASPRERAEWVADDRPEGHWPAWIARWCGIVGAILFLAGVLFFFASNWKELSPLIRLGILQVAVVVAATAACIRCLRTEVGRWLLLGAAVFTGILQAVFGQVYQTGADAFEVFALWSVLIVAWVVVARFDPLYILWLAVTETALVLYGGQVLVPDGVANWPVVLTAIGLFTLAVFAYRETSQPEEPAGEDWVRFLLVAATLVWFSITPFRWIFDIFSNREEWGWRFLGSAAWLAVIVVGIRYFQNIRPSVGNLSLCLLTLAVIVVCAFARLVLESGDDAGQFFIVAIFSVAAFSGVSAWIFRFAKRLKSEPSTPPSE